MFSITGIIHSHDRLASGHSITCLAASVILLASVIIHSANAQERVCPDGKRSYFDVCPGETVLPGPLQAKIENLANFPDSIQIPPPATILENYLTDKLPQKLYGIILEASQKEIVAVPEVGDNLYIFKGDYYNFRNRELALENIVLPKIGDNVQAQVPDAWLYYLRYFVMRAGGLQQGTIKASGNFFNYGITWDDAERVFGILSSDPKIAADTAETIKLYNRLSTETSKILAQARR